MDDIEKLAEDLESVDSSVRRAAAYILSETKDRRALPVLIRALKSEDSAVRKWAAEGLAKIGDESAVSGLVEALEDEDKEVQDCARWALIDLGSLAVPEVIRVLAKKDDDLQEHAVKILENCKDASAVPALVKVLEGSTSSTETSMTAARGLMNIGIPAVSALLGASGNEIVLSHARWVIEEIFHRCGEVYDLRLFERSVNEGFDIFRKANQDKDKLIDMRMRVAKLMKRISEKKNELAYKRSVLLPDKPKPPKKGPKNQNFRRLCNG